MDSSALVRWDTPGGGAPGDPAINSLGMASTPPPNPTVSRQEAMQDLWEQAGLESVDTRVIRIPVVYSDFDDFWRSNSVPIGPQGKMIDSMSPQTRELLRTRLRNNLPIASDGRIAYAAFANAVKGRVPG
jgi:allophanate hydrolase subunit 1